MYNWLSVNGILSETSASVHTAFIDDRRIAQEAGDRGNEVRVSPRDYVWTIVVTSLGAGDDVDVDGLVAGAWVSLATAMDVNDTLVVNASGAIQAEAIRLTWTGAGADGAGQASFTGERKFNGRG